MWLLLLHLLLIWAAPNDPEVSDHEQADAR